MVAILIVCRCGKTHTSLEEWRECPMTHQPQYTEQEWYGTMEDIEDDDRRFVESLASNIWLTILIFIFIVLYYPSLLFGSIADRWGQRRLQKRQNAAIQEQAKKRPRRAF